VPSYPVLEIAGTAEDLEIALSFLPDWGCLGAEESEEGSALRAFFPEDIDTAAVARDLGGRLPRLALRTCDPIPTEDWLAQWKKSFTGFSLGERYFVLPTWRPAPEVERTILRLDPEQAFGTGTHDTTRLAATLLERLVRPGDRVIDLGAGTGILAMVAAHQGAASVVAIEPDEDAARCAEDNVARNGLGRIRVENASYESYERLEADVIVANITRPILEVAVLRMDAPTLVLSGLLVEEVDDFATSLPPGFRVCETWTSGEWAALVLAMDAMDRR
jgi:ribosomal protein L11 methyltransferase